MNNLPDWNKIRTDIDLEQYFLFKMGSLYHYDKYKRAYVLDNNGNHGDIIRFFYHEKSGVKMYYSIVFQDSGDIIQFIKKRILQNENASPFEINAEIKEYNGNTQDFTIINKYKSQFNNHIPSLEKDIIPYQYYGNIIQKVDQHMVYLCNYRKLSESIILSDLFHSVFFTYKTKNIESLSYFIKDILGNNVGINRVSTVEGKYFNKKWFDKNSKNGVGFSFSNLIDQTHSLGVFESIFDAISYHELYAPNSIQYCSTNGELSFRKAKLIFEYFNNKDFKRIILGTDNDIAGHYFNLNIISSFIESVIHVRKSEKYISVEMITLAEDQKVNVLKQFFKPSQSKFEVDDTMDFPQTYYTETLSNFENHTYFTISNTIDAIQFCISLLLRIWNLSETIIISQPKNKDFNEDLIELKKQENA